MGNMAKELMYAFMGKKIEKEEEKINVHSLRSMTEELLKLNENDWVLYAFSREPLERKISLEDKFQFAYLARVCGENEANNIAGNDFTKCAENMRFTV